MTRNRGVDREHQGVEAGLGGALNQPVGDLAFPHHVQLEPVAAVRVRLLDVLNRSRTQRRKRKRNTSGTSGGRTSVLAFGLHQAGETGWCNTEWKCGAATEDLHRSVNMLSWFEDVRVEFHVPERLLSAVHADLFLSATIGVVECGGRGAALSDLPQVAHGQRVAEATFLRVKLGFLELQQIKNLDRIGELTANQRSSFL